VEIKEFLAAELDREVEKSRLALEEMPEGHFDWKPHDKSMAFGHLANMVATIPTWICMQITHSELDVAPVAGKMSQKRLETRADLIDALHRSAAEAHAAFAATSDEHLRTNWRLLAAGKVVQEAPRDSMIQDTFNHWAHHRGQMTVYLRLLGAKVPALYGPSADDKNFR
jgi:uncharacterized damage-inducible protein DinB